MAIKERKGSVESKVETVIDIAAVIDTVEKADTMAEEERQRTLVPVAELLNTGVSELLEMSKKVNEWDRDGHARMNISSSTTVLFDRTSWGPMCGFLIHTDVAGSHFSAHISIDPKEDPNTFSEIDFSSTKLSQLHREDKNLKVTRLKSALDFRFNKTSSYSSDFTVASR